MPRRTTDNIPTLLSENLTLSLKEFCAIAIIESCKYNQLGDKVKSNSISHK